MNEMAYRIWIVLTALALSPLIIGEQSITRPAHADDACVKLVDNRQVTVTGTVVDRVNGQGKIPDFIGISFATPRTCDPSGAAVGVPRGAFPECQKGRTITVTGIAKRNVDEDDAVFWGIESPSEISCTP